MRRIEILLILMLLSAGCNGEGDRDPGGAVPTATPIEAPRSPSPSPPLEDPPGRPSRSQLKTVELSLVRIAAIPQAVTLASRLGDESLYVGQRSGRVMAIHEGRVKEILDISSEVTTEGAQGLLGLAFSPAGDHLYASFTDRKGDLRVVEYAFEDGIPDVDTRRTVLSIPQLTVRHVGGNLAFGPDGYLWLSVGDGSLGNDPEDVAQSLASLRGKLLRFDPSPSGGKPYRVPATNPFVDTEGARPEIYAYGLRNPWRFSFDDGTGDLWIGDVGQYHVEEIDFLRSAKPAGANFGWNRLEGTRPFEGDPPPHDVSPIFEYTHGEGGCAVIGGYVYRGAIKELQGAYLYSDLCQGRVRALIEKDGRVVFERGLGLRVPSPVSFGQGPAGEIYVLSITHGVFLIEAA